LPFCFAFSRACCFTQHAFHAYPTPKLLLLLLLLLLYVQLL
jgi:hypothetical protein